MLWRLFKVLIGVAILGAIGITGYAFLGDLTPPPSVHSETLTLGGD